MRICLVEAKKCETDARIVMQWRNDAQTLSMSFHSTPKHWESFYKEYCQEYFKDADLPPLFAMLEEEKVGFLRFKKYEDHTIKGKALDISININPQKRGLGLGSEIIKKGASYLFERSYEVIIAEIKQVNAPSIRAFEKAGFTYLDSLDKKIIDTGEIFPIHRFVMHQPNGFAQ